MVANPVTGASYAKMDGETAVADATPKWADSTKMVFPEELPMEYEYTRPKIYVRDCYPEYYKGIIRMLESTIVKRITVTGTPGIGKSIFYGYFLKRYSFENPLVTIVTVSFTKDGDTSFMKEVVVWRNNIVADEARWGIGLMVQVYSKAVKEATGGVIHLYDGPHNMVPSRDRICCFTSPNKSWFSQNKKDQGHLLMFMPEWSLQELQTAAEVLALRMDPERRGLSLNEMPLVADLVQERFHVFVGVGRECLATSALFVKECEKDIDEVIENFKETDQIQRVLEVNENIVFHHFICHYNPDPNDPFWYTVGEPSVYVKRWLVKRVLRLLSARKEDIVAYLRKKTLAC
ncbi:hypothetical protein PC128_g9127 [Phytophthora cactorum]|nr:hypothetical protein PC128_g9127 [Phytophthora cactorum]